MSAKSRIIGTNDSLIQKRYLRKTSLKPSVKYDEHVQQSTSDTFKGEFEMPIIRPIPPRYDKSMSQVIAAKNYRLWLHRRDVLIRIVERYHHLVNLMQQVYFEDTGKPGSDALCGSMEAVGKLLNQEIREGDKYLTEAVEEIMVYKTALNVMRTVFVIADRK